MALVPKEVSNPTTQDFTIEDILGFNGSPITVVAGVSVFDLTALASDEDLAKSNHLRLLTDANGPLTVDSTFDSASTSSSVVPSPGAELTVNKNQSDGYAGLSETSKITSSQMSAVIASSDLTNDSALEKTANKNSANGYAGLSASSKVASSQVPINVFTSTAGAGGAATEVMTLTGILATDTIIAVSQSVDGANSLPLLGYNTLANDALTGIWSADSGAGAVIVVSVLR